MNSAMNIPAATTANDTNAIAVGNTIEVNGVRIHVYSGSVQVTDLANAGKRGKKVARFTVVASGVRGYEAERAESVATAGEYVKIATSWGFAGALELATRCAASLLNVCTVHHQTLRGVDVAPAGLGTESFQVGRFAVRLDVDSFTIQNTEDPNLDTVIDAGNARDGSAKVRAWVKNSPAFLASMTSIGQVVTALSAAGIKCRSYCAMD